MDAEATAILNQRNEHSAKVFRSLQKHIATHQTLQGQPNLCVYITGSVARSEANPHSDLDVFLVSNNQEEQTISENELTVIKADLLRMAEELEMHPLTGRYLHVHNLFHILKVMGSPADDYSNCFTARMLILLESKCLYNQSVYIDTLKALVSAYYRDYHSHRHAFHPLFLINDIQRYWRTMCLNYEHKRNRPNNDVTAKGKNHIKNLKLKFSRMLTCFSAIIALCRANTTVGQDRVFEVISQRPLDRLIRLKEETPDLTICIDSIVKEYAWFLETVARPEADLVAWILDENNRVSAFAHADKFGDAMFEALCGVADNRRTLRHLMI